MNLQNLSISRNGIQHFCFKLISENFNCIKKNSSCTIFLLCTRFSALNYYTYCSHLAVSANKISALINLRYAAFYFPDLKKFRDVC